MAVGVGDAGVAVGVGKVMGIEARAGVGMGVGVTAGVGVMEGTGVGKGVGLGVDAGAAIDGGVAVGTGEEHAMVSDPIVTAMKNIAKNSHLFTIFIIFISCRSIKSRFFHLHGLPPLYSYRC